MLLHTIIIIFLTSSSVGVDDSIYQNHRDEACRNGKPRFIFYTLNHQIIK